MVYIVYGAYAIIQINKIVYGGDYIIRRYVLRYEFVDILGKYGLQLFLAFSAMFLEDTGKNVIAHLFRQFYIFDIKLYEGPYINCIIPKDSYLSSIHIEGNGVYSAVLDSPGIFPVDDIAFIHNNFAGLRVGHIVRAYKTAYPCRYRQFLVELVDAKFRKVIPLRIEEEIVQQRPCAFNSGRFTGS